MRLLAPTYGFGKTIPQQSTTDYFRATGGRNTLQAYKDGSLGQAVVATSPIVAAARAYKANQYRPTSGLGQFGGGDAGMAGLAVVAALVVVGTGALCYQAGKAMAPNRADAKTWGWVGVPVGLLTGPWGFGVMGIVSNSKRK